MKKQLYLSGMVFVLGITTQLIAMKEGDFTESQFSVSPTIESPDMPSNFSHTLPLIKVNKRSCKGFNFLEAQPAYDGKDIPHHLIIINKPTPLKDLFTLAVNQAHFLKRITYALSLPNQRDTVFEELKLLLGIEIDLSENPLIDRSFIVPETIEHVTLIAQNGSFLCRKIELLSTLFPNRNSFIRHATIEEWKKALTLRMVKPTATAHLSMSLLSKEELEGILKKATIEARSHFGIPGSSSEDYLKLSSEETSPESSESPSTIHHPSPATTSSKESSDYTDDSDII